MFMLASMLWTWVASWTFDFRNKHFLVFILILTLVTKYLYLEVFDSLSVENRKVCQD